METVELDSATFRDLSLIARARGLSHGQAVEYLIDQFHQSSIRSSPEAPRSTGVPVYAIYQGQRVEGLFETTTSGVTVTSQPLQGQWFRSPSGAARAVVAALKPGVSPNRSGYDFWFVASTSKTLGSIRPTR